MKSPCYQCSKRCLLCHAHCTEYADWAAEMKNRNQRGKGEIDAVMVAIGRQKRVRQVQKSRWEEKNRR